jgi:ribonucleoside-diphosphate reductase alpha chain
MSEPTPRRRLPSERRALTHRFVIGAHKGYITVGLYDDGRPGELFIRMGDIGSFERGLLSAVGILASMLLQAGVPLQEIADKFKGSSFEPDGWAGAGAEKRFARSILDYVFRWLSARWPAAEASAR